MPGGCDRPGARAFHGRPAADLRRGEARRALWERLPDFRARARWFIEHKPQLSKYLRFFLDDDRPELISLVDATRLRRVLERMLDEQEFLSPHGLRSLSRRHSSIRS